MFMKRKIKSAKGFTLAELLIVVAIIAVLVAIGIPIFTSQLEKSREAVDLSDVRSAYAEVMMAAITGETTAYYTKDANQTIYKQPGSTPEGNVYSITVEPLKQKQDNWQTALPITIGGVSSTDNVHWVGNPGANGKCRIVYTPAQGATGDYVTFYWEGGTSGDSGNGGTGGDNGNNNGNGDGEDNSSKKEYEDFKKIAIDYPTEAFTGILGQIYLYNGSLYVCTYAQGFNQGGSPEKTDENNWYHAQFSKIQPDKDILTKDNLSPDKWDKNKLWLDNLYKGAIYYNGSDYYIYSNSDERATSSLPPEQGGRDWVKILTNSYNNYSE